MFHIECEVIELKVQEKWNMNSNLFPFSRYKYHFPFLETNGIVTVDDNRVGPLYKHVFPPALAPSLSFVGLPWKVFLHFKSYAIFGSFF